MVHTRHLRSDHWHLNIFHTAAGVSRHRRNRYKVSAARRRQLASRRHLLQIATMFFLRCCREVKKSSSLPGIELWWSRPGLSILLADTRTSGTVPVKQTPFDKLGSLPSYCHLHVLLDKWGTLCLSVCGSAVQMWQQLLRPSALNSITSTLSENQFSWLDSCMCWMP
jgi:hypothetical protein